MWLELCQWWQGRPSAWDWPSLAFHLLPPAPSCLGPAHAALQSGVKRSLVVTVVPHYATLLPPFGSVHAGKDHAPAPCACSWEATVASVGWEDVAGRRRLVATVDLSATPGRYPAPSWWAGADAYAASSLNDLAQPAAFVSIGGQRLRLAAVPRGDGSLLRVDVTDAEAPVRPGDTVCLLGDERGLKDLAEVGTCLACGPSPRGRALR